MRHCVLFGPQIQKFDFIKKLSIFEMGLMSRFQKWKNFQIRTMDFYFLPLWPHFTIFWLFWNKYWLVWKQCCYQLFKLFSEQLGRRVARCLAACSARISAFSDRVSDPFLSDLVCECVNLQACFCRVILT